MVPSINIILTYHLSYRKEYKLKTCALCGKVDGNNWAKHWKRQHPGEIQELLANGESPLYPWCDNWKEIQTAILRGENPPKEIKSTLLSGKFKEGNSFASNIYKSERS